MIGLLVMAVVIGANAQASQQYRAEVPFDFEAGGKQYAAGKYSVGPLSGAIAIRSLETGNMRLLGVSALAGTNDWINPGTLDFHKVNGRYTLSRISTPTFQMEMKIQKRLVAKQSAPDKVIVALH